MKLRVILIWSILLFATRESTALGEGRSSSFVSAIGNSHCGNHCVPAVEQFLSTEEMQLLEHGYVWGWPLVYLHNVQKSLRLIRHTGISGGAPVAPINRLCMLTKPVDAKFHSVPCPNPDVIYGFAMLDLSQQPVVLQIPEADNKIWMIQVGDHRTDSIAKLGSMYKTQAGHYMIVGPQWTGEVPKGVLQVIRSSTDLAYVLPRYFLGENAPESLEPVLSQVWIFPFNQYHGQWKRHNWARHKWYPAIGETTRESCKSVKPASFFADLLSVLESVPPLPDEEEFYGQIKPLLVQLLQQPNGKELLKELAEKLEAHCMVPRFDFRNVGDRLPSLWTTVRNGAAFGTDFETRASVAKSNIFVNRPEEAKYFHVEQDESGTPLTGESSYVLKFPAHQLPPHQGYWTVTVYDENHRLVDHPERTRSIVVSSANTIGSSDGSVVFLLQKDPPKHEDDTHWIPTPQGRFVVYLRVYAPELPVINGHWFPPSILEVELNDQIRYVYTASTASREPNVPSKPQ